MDSSLRKQKILNLKAECFDLQAQMTLGRSQLHQKLQELNRLIDEERKEEKS